MVHRMAQRLARHSALFLVLSLSATAAALAQANATGSLTGTVTDQQGGVIPGAEILAKNDRTGSEFGAIANQRGIWEISSVPFGSYTVSVKAPPSFRTETFNEIKVDTETAVTVDAMLHIGLTEKVTVTASRFEQQVMNAPATVSVISEREIQALTTQNFGDLFRAIPGVNVVQTAANSVGVVSRAAGGASPISQLGLVDGRSMYGEAMGGTGWTGFEIGLDDVKQVEVIRGPASAVWGSYAMDGVINIITRTPREMLGNTLTFGIGTFDRSGGAAESDTGALYYVRASHAQALNDRLAYKITGGVYTQDAFARPQGTIPNDFLTPYPEYTNEGTTRPNLDARIDYDHPDGKQHFDFAGGYISSGGIFPAAAGGADIDATQSYGKVGYVHGSTRITGYVNADSFNGHFLLVTDPTGQPQRWDGETLTYHVEFGDYRTAWDRHLFSYGANFRYAQFRNLSFAPDADNRIQGGAYLQDEILLSDRFSWIVGARIDRLNILKGVVVSPRTTLIIKPMTGQTFRVSYNRGYLAPSPYARDIDFPILITIDLEGNPFSLPIRWSSNGSLKEQSLNAYEIGYTALMAKDRINLGAAFYINDSNGSFYSPQTESYTSQNPPPGWPLPLWVLDAMIEDPNTFGPGLGLPSVYTTSNRGKVRDKGMELSADIRLNRYMAGYVNYSWQARPESRDFDIFDINLPPAHRFNAGMDFDYNRYLGSISLGYMSSAFWNDVLTAQFSGWTRAYTVINLGGGIRWGESFRYRAMVRVANLANSLVQNHVYGDILKRQISGEFKISF